MRWFGRRGGEPPQRIEEPPERPRAERPGELPPDGPEGRRIGNRAWVTATVPERPLEAWSRHAARFAETGLWPLLVERRAVDVDVFVDEPDDPPWEEQAARDAEAILRQGWADSMPLDDDEEDEEFFDEVLAPFGREFPGTGRGAGRRVERAAQAAALALDGVEAIALVPVTRPADATAAGGWAGAVNYYDEQAQLAAVLRAWEERYDAIPVGLGFDTLYLAVRRPATGDDALLAAAEQYAFCSDNVDQGVGSIRALADHIDGAKAWTFWWD